MLRVLLADDHAIVRKGLREILREIWADTIVGEAADGPQALAAVQAEPWDLLILDVTMPGLNGVQVLRQVRRSHPGLPVLMLSMHTGQAYVEQSLKEGAAGYLCKESAADELLTAIQTVLDGGIYVSQGLAAGLSQWAGQAANEAHSRGDVGVWQSNRV
jgi:two-component system, NarL family, invasion response regulator UvrY